MATDNKKFHHSSLQDADSIAELLEAITEGISKGKLQLSDDTGDIQLRPRGLLELSVDVEEDSGNNSLAIRLRWSDAARKVDRKTLKIR
jgi:hypothetical protein